MAMVQSCQEKYALYEDFITRNQIEFGAVPWSIDGNGTIFSRDITLKNHDEINELERRINFFEQEIR